MKNWLKVVIVSFVMLLIAGRTEVYAADEADTTAAKARIVEAMENFQAECDLSMYQISAKQIQSIFEDVLYNNPQLFYVDNHFNYTYVSSSNTILTLKMNYEGGAGNAKSMVKKYNAKRVEIASGIDKSWSELEKLLYIHDYICANCVYDSGNAKDDAYDMLIGGSASCQGYSKAFKQLANDMGITCTLVNSSTIDHQWNYVVMNGKYYYIDVTWDDLVPDLQGRIVHTHFLKSYSAIMSDGMHNKAVKDLYAKDGSDVTKATSKTYDNYFWKNVNTAFYNIGGKWYTVNANGRISCYTCNGKSMKLSRKITTVTDKWYVWKSTKNFYTIKYVGFSAYDGHLYYSTTNAVYHLNLTSGKSTKVYSLSKANAKKGYIYGMCIADDGTVRITLGTSGATEGTVRKAFQLKTLQKPVIKNLKKTKKGIKVKWSKVKNASGYYVYARAGSGKWKKIATVKGAGKVTYVDTTAVKKKTYRYKVYAYYKCPAGKVASGASAAKKLKRS